MGAAAVQVDLAVTVLQLLVLECTLNDTDMLTADILIRSKSIHPEILRPVLANPNQKSLLITVSKLNLNKLGRTDNFLIFRVLHDNLDSLLGLQ